MAPAQDLLSKYMMNSGHQIPALGYGVRFGHSDALLMY